MALEASDDVFDEAALPPELTMDEAPLSDASLDEFARLLAQVADSVGCTQEEALDLLWEPPADVELPPMPPEIEAFGRAVDESSADWAMAKYGQASRRLAEAEAKKVAYVERIGRWHAREAKRYEADLAYFGMLLEAFGRARRTDKVKTWNLPTGKLGSSARNVGGKVTVVDKDEVMAWLQGEVGARWLADAVFDAGDAINSDTERIYEVLGEFARQLLTADPYGGAVKVTRTLLASKLDQFITVKDGRAVDHLGVPVPGAGVEPERVTYTIKPS